ncbi:hypothetical protein [Pseudophaeobacter sp.]|uniref:hypothetical protein n=1 Tax=Pseudophaeobacter sp. TaxID=1971739 RepID=UPI0040595856
MKILAFGNSHSVCLKQAYSDSYQGSTQYDFIARGQGRKGLQGVTFVDGKPFHEEPHTFTPWCTEDLSTYSAFVFIGNGLPPQPQREYSSALLCRWKEDTYTTIESLRLSRELIRITGKKCIILPRPFRGGARAQLESYATHEAHVQWLNSWVDDGITYVTIPKETTLQGMTKTKLELLKEDASHANEMYGAIWLKKLDEILDL